MATACAVSTCVNSTCGLEPAPKGTACIDDNGKMCDADGKCVQCIKPADCVSSAAAACTEGVYTAPPTCEQGACVPGQVTDCSAMQLGCTKKGCGSCSSHSDCDESALGMCKANRCVDGACTKVVTVAADCGQGTCGVGGDCTSAKHVFVTSFGVQGILGGVSAAKEQCKNAAEAGGLGGTWFPWMSDAGTSPLQVFTKNLNPYRLLDSAATIVAHDWASLASGSLVHAIDRDELGNLVPYGTHVWTGTLPDGTHSGLSCGGWSNDAAAVAGSYGKVGASGGGWTKLADQECPLEARLYCFQQ